MDSLDPLILPDRFPFLDLSILPSSTPFTSTLETTIEYFLHTVIDSILEHHHDFTAFNTKQNGITLPTLIQNYQRLFRLLASHSITNTESAASSASSSSFPSISTILSSLPSFSSTFLSVFVSVYTSRFSHLHSFLLCSSISISSNSNLIRKEKSKLDDGGEWRNEKKSNEGGRGKKEKELNSIGGGLNSYDWNVRVCVSSDRMAKMRVPLIQLILRLKDAAGVERETKVEMTKQQLDQLIDAGEAAATVVKKYRG